MSDNISLIKFSFSLLRFAFLSCWGIETIGGKWRAKKSKMNFLVNLSTILFLGYIFSQVVVSQNNPTIYKTSPIVFPLFAQCLIVINIMFILSGNTHNRKFINIINHFGPIKDCLTRNFGVFPFRSSPKVKWIVCGGITALILETAIKLVIEFHLLLSYPRIIRVVHYFTSFCVTFVCIHFIATMAHLRDNYAFVNCFINKMIGQANREVLGLEKNKKAPTKNCCLSHTTTDKLELKKKFRTWMTAYMNLRDVEHVVDQVFGKEIFLTLLSVFSCFIINVYYLVAMNLYKTGNIWINICFVIGLMEGVVVLYVVIRAAETTANEVSVTDVTTSFDRRDLLSF